MRRFLMSCVLAASTAVALLANHQVTFVMRSGERISGGLSYKGGSTYTLNGRDYESRDVAMISFVSDEPSAAELSQIPQVDNNPTELERHVFVTRDGKVMLGKLWKFSPDGETVWFDARDGGRRDISANDMARVYINPAAARSVYNNVGTAREVATNGGDNRTRRRPGTNDGSDRNGQQPGGFNDGNDRNGRRPGGSNDGDDRNGRQPVGTNGRLANNGRATVNGNQPWTDTGIDVRKGDLITFSATGQVRVALGNSRDVVADPDGAVRFPAPRNNYPYPGMAVGGLIARVGNDRPFGIGTITQPISMPDDGRLYLGINDDGFGDNSGRFNVTINRFSNRSTNRSSR